MRSFYIRKLPVQLLCAYVLGSYLTGVSLPAQKLRVERWWNWALAPNHDYRHICALCHKVGEIDPKQREEWVQDDQILKEIEKTRDARQELSSGTPESESRKLRKRECHIFNPNIIGLSMVVHRLFSSGGQIFSEEETRTYFLLKNNKKDTIFFK